jgi:hypothetical protein
MMGAEYQHDHDEVIALTRSRNPSWAGSAPLPPFIALLSLYRTLR